VISITDSSSPQRENLAKLWGKSMTAPKFSSSINNQLQAIGEPVLKPKGTVLLREGQPGGGAFLIKSGSVNMTLAANPKLYPSRRLGCGRVIGLPATFSGEPYSLTAECATNCRLYFIPRQNLLELIQHDPSAGFQIVRILSDEIFQMRKSAGRVPKKTHGKARRA
jgi:CRP-like cAMP-binding protein